MWQFLSFVHLTSAWSLNWTSLLSWLFIEYRKLSLGRQSRWEKWSIFFGSSCDGCKACPTLHHKTAPNKMTCNSTFLQSNGQCWEIWFLWQQGCEIKNLNTYDCHTSSVREDVCIGTFNTSHCKDCIDWGSAIPESGGIWIPVHWRHCSLNMWSGWGRCLEMHTKKDDIWISMFLHN